MMKFLDLKNKADEKIWLKIIDEGHSANLHRCPYDQDFEASKACPKYEKYGDTLERECQFVLITNSKCFCELQPSTKG